ncbi:hypothetical protein [Spiroplasma sp. SV19]|uniref:hypothetical protein n=1 Tax=Spiroplasma sp. SV19 TaxID=2570468 RepID=UPI0024B81C86|nr:hypothetical protein [Spiroplasma sp. SV19]WHQ37547.1 hypothetical protein E7Y35_06870 [Spiroplasma sp. SV19]
MDSEFTKYYNQLMHEVNLISNVEKISDTKKDWLYTLLKNLKTFNTKQVKLQQHEGLIYQIMKVIDQSTEFIHNRISNALNEYRKLYRQHFKVNLDMRQENNRIFAYCEKQLEANYGNSLQVLRDSVINYYYLNYLKDKIEETLKIISLSARTL